MFKFFTFYLVVLSLLLSVKLSLGQCSNTANFVPEATVSLVSGSPNWVNPNNILGNDALTTTYSFSCPTPPCTTGTNPASILVGGNFPSLPTNAIVCGLTVQVVGSTPSGPFGGGNNISLEVRLLNNVTQIGRKFTFDGLCFPFFTCGSYGGTNDLWGNPSLSVADLTSGNFKFSFVPNINIISGGGNANLSVNYFNIRVNYNLPTPTPVEIINFKAHDFSNSYKFEWSAIEEEMDYYEIEAKKEEEWTVLAKIPAKGNGYQLYEETLTAHENGSIARLKATDKTGKVSYSKEVDLLKNVLLDFNKKVLQVYSKNDSQTYIQINTINGIQIESTFVDHGKYKYDFTNNNPGLYFIQIIHNNEIQRLKIIID